MVSTAAPGNNIADNGGTGGPPDQGSASYSPSDVKDLKRMDDEKNFAYDRHVFG